MKIVKKRLHWLTVRLSTVVFTLARLLWDGQSQLGNMGLLLFLSTRLEESVVRALAVAALTATVTRLFVDLKYL